MENFIEEMGKKLVLREWDEYDLAEDARVDKNNLDLVAEEHSHIVQKWLDLLTQAEDELAKAKEEYEDTVAELQLLVRREGIQGIEGRVTDAVASAWMTQQPKFKRVRKRKREAEKYVSYLNNAKKVLEHRKEMIKTDRDLWICGYFARPRIKGGDQKQDSEYREVVKKELGRRHLRRDTE